MSQKNLSSTGAGKVSKDTVLTVLRDFGHSPDFVDAVIKSTCGGFAHNDYYVEIQDDGRYQVWPDDEISQQEMTGTFIPVPALSEQQWKEADEPGNTLAKVINRHRTTLLDQMLTMAETRLSESAAR